MKKFLFAFSLAAAFLSAALVASPAFAAQSNGVGTSDDFHGPVGMCMYSLRDICEKQSVDAAMQFAEDCGFTIVEASNFFGLSASEYKELLDKHHLSAPSLPMGYGQLKTTESLDKVIADAKAIGAKYVRVASIPHSGKTFTLEEAQEAVRVFNEAGEYLAKNGLAYCYHNHGFEFVKYDGCPEDECLFDVIVRGCDPRFVNFEMDVRWVIAPGYDPVVYMKRYPGRFKLMHVKDVSGKDGMLFEQGPMDFPAVLKTAQEVGGVEYYFIEHDDTRNIEAVTPRNIQFLEGVKF